MNTEPFEPTVFYLQAMDSLSYLREDVSYRAEHVDPHLTLFWHPHEIRLIGFRVDETKGLVVKPGWPDPPKPFLMGPLLQAARKKAQNPDGRVTAAYWIAQKMAKEADARPSA